MNDVLAGTFTSRINMNLREDKHWSYGARSNMADARGQRPWLLSAPVQTDKTVDALREIQREVTEFVTTRPATPEEVTRIRNRDVRALSGSYETNAAVAGAIAEIVTFGGPTTTCARSRRASRRRATTACGRPRARRSIRRASRGS